MALAQARVDFLYILSLCFALLCFTFVKKYTKKRKKQNETFIRTKSRKIANNLQKWTKKRPKMEQKQH